MALLRTGRQGVATSGAGGQALRVGRASELRAGAGEPAAGGSQCGLPARSSPSAARSRAPQLPPRPLLSIPPTEPSAALQWLVRGRGAPSGSVLRVPEGREVGGHRAPPRNPPFLAGDCLGWGVTGTVRSPPAPPGRLGPRRQSCQQREVSRAARGGDAVRSGVLHTPRRIPGLRVQIKGRGPPSACSSVHFLLLRLRDEEGPVAHVSWTDSLSALPLTLIVLAGAWDGGSTRRGKISPPTGSARRAGWWTWSATRGTGGQEPYREGTWCVHPRPKISRDVEGRLDSRNPGYVRHSVGCALCSSPHIPPSMCVQICTPLHAHLSPFT